MPDAPPVEDDAPGPKGPIPRPASKLPRWFWAVVVVAVLVHLAFYAIVFPRPAIALSDFSYATNSCSRLGNSSTISYTYYFTLTNSGTADGSVLVWFYMDGNFVVYYARYVVTRGTAERILWNTNWADCNPHTPSVSITDESRV